ncbi:MAG: phosphoribosylamine--glycine ligase [Actinobacteria bacterium]|nr:phosphoribosylamine--glycine ligase [Actinomycetota bacterium]
MRVLVVGSGAREHTLAWALARSPQVDEIVAAPGNPGIEALGRCLPVDLADPAAIASLADDVGADLTVVGPEAPLVAGAVDALEARGRAAFGPRADAARLEGSKAWMKRVLTDAGVPTARYAAFRAGEEQRALAFLETLPGFYVVKTDGLAAGKGVVVTESLAEARDTVREYLSGAAFGEAGRTCVIEEGLSGPEVSLLVLCDGSTDGVPLAPAQDFKRVGDGDVGPNTGGMGAYSPVPAAGAALVDEVVAKIIGPTLHALAVPYRGVLYAGLMLTPEGPKVIEYNVRFGDPECEAVVPRLRSDLGAHALEAASSRLATPVAFGDDACVTVVMAAEGYPARPRTGDVIEGLEAAEALDDVLVFHAGTKRDPDGSIVTAGGRVLAVSATATSTEQARARAYEAVGAISWPGAQYRRDIAATAYTERRA